MIFLLLFLSTPQYFSSLKAIDIQTVHSRRNVSYCGQFTYQGNISYFDRSLLISELTPGNTDISPHYCAAECHSNLDCNAIEMCSFATGHTCRLSREIAMSLTTGKDTCSRYELDDTCGWDSYFNRRTNICQCVIGCVLLEKIMENTEEELIRPIYKNGRYQNPFDTWTDTVGMGKFFKLIFSESDHSKIPNQRELDKTLPVETPDFQKLRNPPDSEIQMMWIGHASVLVQMDGLTILADPIFSDRCSPVQFAGPKRYRPPPCKIEDLPHIDAVIISHNHYDHLDHGSVKSLNSKFQDKITWFVAAGTKEWMLNAGCKNVVELSWWDEAEMPGRPDFKFVSVPCQHRCERTLLDSMKALWCSWVVKGPQHSFYFAGDTGYCSGFKQIGRKYGPIDFAAIPIGAYYPRWFMRPMHVDPEEAVKIFEDVKAEHALGIHWGTFKMTREFYLEPREKLGEELDKKNIRREKFFTLRHGLVHTIGHPLPS